MPLLNTIICDCGCQGLLELGGPSEQDVSGAEFLLEVTDANRKKFFFLNENCFKKWAAKYISPYKRPEYVPLDAILPGEKAN
jgi:hypothetical protein